MDTVYSLGGEDTETTREPPRRDLIGLEIAIFPGQHVLMSCWIIVVCQSRDRALQKGLVETCCMIQL
jgi:hypothetical protein